VILLLKMVGIVFEILDVNNVADGS